MRGQMDGRMDRWMIDDGLMDGEMDDVKMMVG